MIELQDESAARGLLRRFSNFDDGLLVEIGVEFPRGERTGTVELHILGQEPGSPAPDDGWRSVLLRLEACTTFLFSEDRTSYQVLADGLGLDRLPDGTWFVDLAPFTDADVPAADRRANSAQYCVGHRLFSAVEPYRK